MHDRLLDPLGNGDRGKDKQLKQKRTTFLVNFMRARVLAWVDGGGWIGFENIEIILKRNYFIKTLGMQAKHICYSMTASCLMLASESTYDSSRNLF